MDMSGLVPDRDADFDSVLSGQIASFETLFDGKTIHADDAINFSDEDELAEEEEEFNEGEGEDEDDEHHDENEGRGELGGEDEDGDEDDQEEDDFMKELQEEAMEGVDTQNDGDIDAVFGMGVPNNAGLQDLDFASNSILDSSRQIGDSDLELSDVENDEDIDADGLFGELELPNRVVLSAEEKRQIAEKRRLEKEAKEKRNREKLLRIFYPTFKKGKPMQLQKLFPIIPLEYSYQVPAPITKPLLPKTTHFEIEDDQRKEFKMSSKQRKEQNKFLKKSTHFLPEPEIVKIDPDEFIDRDEEIEKNKVKIEPIHYENELILSTADWNDDDIVEASEDLRIIPPAKRLKVTDFNLDAWADEDDNMIFEGNLDVDLLNLKLDMNDPNLIFVDEIQNVETKKQINNDSKIPTTQKLLEMKYSVSNDKEYECLKSNYQTKVRATIGALNIDHAPPAQRLQSPFYKVKPTDKENRIFHRHKFPVKVNMTMFFSKPKIRKKKRDKGKDISEIFRRSNDLTLGDTAPFFLCEYSEEYPMMLNKFGMGSKIFNYYRKRDDDDNTRPKLSIGETHVLGVQDRSPFWNFGVVEKGSVVPTLYNKLIRAPLFHHEALSTDFLLIRSTGGGIGNGQRFYLRPVNYMFTVGQTLPAMEVPGPHSRRATSLMKNRLKMIAYRVLNKSDATRITVKDISEHFPDHSDMQIRQRLKEFMEYQRGGADQGFWKLKAADKLLSFEQIKRMMTPEDVCLLETMLWSKQYFEDVDLFRRERLQEFSDNSKKEKEAEETLTEQLAPWNISRNFIQATQGKAMLQINGVGDPSRIGEAISFLKISMKGGFIKSVEGESNSNNNGENGTSHSYNVAVQQKLYDEEIAKVWYKQARSLSRYRNSDKPRIVELDELSDSKALDEANKTVDGEVNEKPRYLRITRMVKNAYGIKERKIQVIRDPKVVELYVKKKQQQLLETSEDAISINANVLTNDKEENMKVKKKLEEELAKLEKQAEKKRKKQQGITAANIDSEGRLSGKGIGKGRSTSRRCATCGGLGHIRTNKTCPLYYTVHNKSNPNYIPGSDFKSASAAAKQQMLQQKYQTTGQAKDNTLPIPTPGSTSVSTAVSTPVVPTAESTPAPPQQP